MKNIIIILSFIFIAWSAFAEDCVGTRWEPSNGASCISIGLNSRQGTCIRGEEYEILCDDMQGFIKTCYGQNSCYRRPEPPVDCRLWDFDRNDYCQPGYINRDCSGGCGFRIER
jgi:hypothetical protein